MRYDGGIRNDPSTIGEPGKRGLWTRFRFHPPTLIALAGFALIAFGFDRAVADSIFWWHRESYREADFVLGEAHENEGYPYLSGRVEPGDVEWVLSAERLADGRFTVAGQPELLFEPGRRVRVWWSDAAPSVGFSGAGSTKLVPVAELPELPGLARPALWLAKAVPVVWAALFLIKRFRTIERRTVTVSRT